MHVHTSNNNLKYNIAYVNLNIAVEKEKELGVVIDKNAKFCQNSEAAV